MFQREISTTDILNRMSYKIKTKTTGKEFKRLIYENPNLIYSIDKSSHNNWNLLHEICDKGDLKKLEILAVFILNHEPTLARARWRELNRPDSCGNMPIDILLRNEDKNFDQLHKNASDKRRASKKQTKKQTKKQIKKQIKNQNKPQNKTLSMLLVFDKLDHTMGYLTAQQSNRKHHLSMGKHSITPMDIYCKLSQDTNKSTKPWVYYELHNIFDHELSNDELPYEPDYEENFNEELQHEPDYEQFTFSSTPPTFPMSSNHQTPPTFSMPSTSLNIYSFNDSNVMCLPSKCYEPQQIPSNEIAHTTCSLPELFTDKEISSPNDETIYPSSELFTNEAKNTLPMAYYDPSTFLEDFATDFDITNISNDSCNGDGDNRNHNSNNVSMNASSSFYFESISIQQQITDYGISPVLADICRNGNLELIEFLLDRGFCADYIYYEGQHQTNPLMSAVEGGHVEICDLLINKKVDLEMSESFVPITPFYLAIVDSKLEIARLLAQSGANIHYTNDIGYGKSTPLHGIVEKCGDGDILKQIIALVQFHSWTICSVAPIQQTFLDYKDKNGNTALDVAIMRCNNYKNIHILRALGCSFNESKEWAPEKLNMVHSITESDIISIRDNVYFGRTLLDRLLFSMKLSSTTK